MPTQETTALAIIETITPVDLFKPEVIDPILERIAAEVREQAAKLDISTPFNRSELASLAYKVGKTKTYAESVRLDLVSGEKKKLARIDARGKATKDYLQALQDETRKPLTDWEQADKDRILAHEEAIQQVVDMGLSQAIYDSNQVDEQQMRVDHLLKSRDWQEFTKKAIDSHAHTSAILHVRRDESFKREAESSELSRLRAESAARDQKEREERIAREAVEKVQRAQFEAEARAKAAEEAAAQAEARHAAEMKASEERVEAAKRQAELAAKVQAKAKREAEEAEAKRREESKRIRNRVHAELEKALTGINTADLTIGQARDIINAIAADEIPHVSITY
jgi:colicin import membrane protein